MVLYLKLTARLYSILLVLSYYLLLASMPSRHGWHAALHVWLATVKQGGRKGRKVDCAVVSLSNLSFKYVKCLNDYSIVISGSYEVKPLIHGSFLRTYKESL